MWEDGRDAINRHLAMEVDGSLWYGRVRTIHRLTVRFPASALRARTPSVLHTEASDNRLTGKDVKSVTLKLDQ